ncbi:ABC transporter permease [Acidaminobacter sp. JC074]|uniref:ABC transporter permease n=1 Tax=Acidaminobacter sp. JC074 TaxID=2530199 RepID=UPI001F1147C9|nr:ABC transporter permease [Acidaminobacter sp. JC074]MCH4887055.1 ABC transporter permease [Acidaminobacter sp. JC074]
MEIAAKNQEKRIKKKSLWADAWHRMKRNKSSVIAMVLLGMIFLTAILAPVLIDYDTDVVEPDMRTRLQFPAEGHALGTDELGRDIFSRILYGSRFSLSAGILTVVFSSFIGITIGAVAGYYGGLFDTILMRMMDILLAIPGMLLMITIVTALEPNFMNLIIAMSISSIPSSSRMIRVQVMKVKNQEFIEAVKVLGASDLRIILVHILPNAISPLISSYAMAVAGGIMGISAMSFLGLGVQPPNPEWGAMLSSGKAFIRDVWHVTAFPGIAIVIVVVLLTLLGDGLRDALDPKMKR